MTINRTALDFAAAARAIGRATRRRRMIVAELPQPAPPRRCRPVVATHIPTARSCRSARRVVPWPAVVSDMIEGVVVTNALLPPLADQVRTELWHAAGFEGPLLRKVA